MLDMHNHVLFGLDDGCRTLEESSELAKRARRAGHEGFVATPHIRPGIFDNTPDGIRARRDEVRPHIEAAGLELYLGAEYYFSIELLEAAQKKRLLTLGETSRYVLAEMPTHELPARYEAVLYEIRLAGYIPVIAHPERCRGIQQNPQPVLETFERTEVCLQLDLGSLIGFYGEAAQKLATAWVKAGVYHVAACDLHRPEDVASVVEPSLKRLNRLFARKKRAEAVQALTVENPRRILQNAARDRVLASGRLT